MAGVVEMADFDLGSTINAIMDLVRHNNGTDISNANQAAALADPFASQRAGYQKQLQGLLTDPNSFQIDPGTEYSINAGNDAITRAANAQGVSRGGSVVSDIGKNVTGQSEAAYNNRIQQLLTASGATTGSPAAAAAALTAGQNTDASRLSSTGSLADQILSLLSGGKGASGLTGAAASIWSAIKGNLGGDSSGGGVGTDIPMPNDNIGGDGGSSPLVGGDNPPTPMITGGGGINEGGDGGDLGGVGTNLGGNDIGGIDWGSIFDTGVGGG